MAFIKKVLLLKQTVHDEAFSSRHASAIFRAETDCGVTSIYLSAVNFPAVTNGDYKLVFAINGGKLICFDIGKRPSNFSTVSNDFPENNYNISVGIALISNGVPKSVAFAKEDQSPLCFQEFKKRLAEKCLEDYKCLKIIKPKPCPVKKEDTPLYDDEAVATENYFELEKSIQNKLDVIKEKENERLRNENGNFAYKREEEKEKRQTCSNTIQNEENACDFQETDKFKPYFLKMEKELNSIFNTFPPYNKLKQYFPNSIWAKITYAGEKYYVVGLIKEENQVSL